MKAAKKKKKIEQRQWNVIVCLSLACIILNWPSVWHSSFYYRSVMWTYWIFDIWYFWKTCLLLSAFFLSRMFLGGRQTYLVQSDGKADDIPRTKNKRYTWFLMSQEKKRKKIICRRNNQSQNYPHISIWGRSSKSSSASLRIFLWEPSLESHWECHKCQEWRNLM